VGIERHQQHGNPIVLWWRELTSLTRYLPWSTQQGRRVSIVIVVVLASLEKSLTFVYVHLALPLFLSLTHSFIMSKSVSENNASPGPGASERQKLGDQAQSPAAFHQM
jgi:hypothetical protein